MYMIIADICLVVCTKTRESGRFIRTKSKDTSSSSFLRAWQNSFLVADFQWLSSILRLQRTQPVPSSLSLLWELACFLFHSFPATCLYRHPGKKFLDYCQQLLTSFPPHPNSDQLLDIWGIKTVWEWEGWCVHQKWRFCPVILYLENCPTYVWDMNWLIV